MRRLDWDEGSGEEDSWSVNGRSWGGEGTGGWREGWVEMSSGSGELGGDDDGVRRRWRRSLSICTSLEAVLHLARDELRNKVDT